MEPGLHGQSPLLSNTLFAVARSGRAKGAPPVASEVSSIAIRQPDLGSRLEPGQCVYGSPAADCITMQQTSLRDQSCCASRCLLKIVSAATIDRDGVLVIKQLNPKRNGVTLRIEKWFNESHLIRTMTGDSRHPATIDRSLRVDGPDVE